jgi:hypothetical protein
MKQQTTKTQHKLSIYPTQELRERIDLNYIEYLKDCDGDDMINPLSKSGYIAMLLNRALNAHK